MSNRKKRQQDLGIWLSFPQVWVFFGILVFAIASILISVFSEGYISSLFANIFAGLITGLVLAALSGIRQIYYARNDEVLNWLKDLEKTIQKYLPLHMQLICKDYDSEKREEFIYDILCIGTDVLGYIVHSPENYKYGFNPMNYCKKYYGMDVKEVMDHSQALRDRIRYEDIPADDRDVWDWFEEFDKDLHTLHSLVIKDIRKRESQIAALKRSII